MGAKTSAVLVTGSSGLLGNAVGDALVDAGLQVRGVDRREGRHTKEIGDLRQRDVQRRALTGVNCVVHLAALHAPHVGHVPDAEFWSTNVEMTTALLQEAADAGVTRVVYVSSTSIYSRSLVPHDKRAVWVDEDLQVQPRDVYDETKLAAEGLVLESSLSTVVLRVARCFSEPEETLARHRLHRGVDARDIAMAAVLALSKGSGVLNITGSLLFEPEDTATLYLDAPGVINKRAPKIVEAFLRRGFDLPNRIDRVYDSSAATRVLGYQPRYGVLELLEDEHS